MADYWHTRYLETLLKVDESTNPKVRSAYMDLAEHYRAMRRLCTGGAIDPGYRSAA